MKNKELWQNKKYRYDAKNMRYRIQLANVNPRSVYLHSLTIEAYATVIGEHAKGQLLDLGCGIVPYWEMYRDRVEESHCVDWENSDHENLFLDEFADLNNPLPFSDQRFDTVLLTDVLEHIYRPLELVQEVSRILKKDGKMIVTVPFFYWLHEPPFDFYRYTEYSLRQFCKDSGLSVISLEAYGGYPDVMLDLLNKKLVTNIHLAKIFMGITRLFRGSAWFKRWRKRTNKSFPMGYCLVAQKADT